MSIVNNLNLRSDIDFSDVSTKRTRTITAPYALFILAAKESKIQSGQAIVVECPKDRVHIAEVAKQWVSSMLANVKSRANREGVVVRAKQVTSESETGLGVAIQFVGLAEPKKA